VPVSDTYQVLPQAGTRNPFDYFHANSVEPDRDGTLVISARNTFAAYKLDRRTGGVVWTLGGKHSTFKLGPGASFAFQHDVRVRANNDMFVTIFDDGAGPPNVHSQSRGLKLILDVKHRTARRVAEHQHALLAAFEGNFQQLPNRNDFLGWGQQPYFSEYDPGGRLLFDAHFVGSNATYRAFRLPWNGTPTDPPAVAYSGGKTPTVYASWNGATNVASWRVVAGATPVSLQGVATAPKRGFETSIRIRAGQAYVAVQALDGAGHALSTSSTVKAG
jgi:hypothetical protein